MIRQATTPRAKLRFYNACRGKLCLGATMPLALELLGKSQPGRFFAGPTLALDIGGSTAWMAGHANPEELQKQLQSNPDMLKKLAQDPNLLSKLEQIVKKS